MKCKYKQISIEELTKLVKESISIAELMRKLGYTANRGNSFKGLKDYLIENNIDFSHFLGRAHGTTNNTKYTLEEIMVENSTYSNMTKFKSRLIKANLIEYKCSCCGITEWNGKPLTLQLHHINGNNRDNRLENLQMLCPNCHSQTDNYCGQANKAAKYFCELCGAEKKTKAARYCPKCAAKMAQKVDLPAKDNLINKFKELKSFVAVGQFYKVSDNTVRKWCKKYEIPYTKKELVLFLKDSD